MSDSIAEGITFYVECEVLRAVAANRCATTTGCNRRVIIRQSIVIEDQIISGPTGGVIYEVEEVTTRAGKGCVLNCCQNYSCIFRLEQNAIFAVVRTVATNCVARERDTIECRTGVVNAYIVGDRAADGCVRDRS